MNLQDITGGIEVNLQDISGEVAKLQGITGFFLWDQKWPNLDLNDGHARARIGEHVTKLISLHSFHTKNISSKFHRNLMDQNRVMLENVHFGPDQPNCPAHFCPFCPLAQKQDFCQKCGFRRMLEDH